MKPLSQEEADHLNLLRFVSIVFGVDFGTLWWVDDRIWQREISEFRPPRVGLSHHPGVSIARKTRQPAPETYPMLFGTSGSHGPVCAKGITPNDDRTTSFGTLAPAELGAADFAASSNRPERPSIKSNIYKLLLEPDEQEALEEFLHRSTAPPTL